MQEEDIRKALDMHWHVSAVGDANAEHDIITYEGRATYTVSIMEFHDGKVVHETQYFADPFEAPAWRQQWVERVG